ncbi:LOW QUALITY PROTEIN: hypothetical protein Cgig2_009961 [Carnegiea gigantea]|uniref:DUF641 domain-containing protein n=1 Tax=Carnegiea gigantea TaxID=171969 RepID=A0A9Q1Q820_9CARY|nr:LOW QUALITY PROTEIN: hypothetical protein Cgig2_009961 [Carnegiea gigantea]
MPDMEGSVKPPQISEMFQKFALSFKSKAFEFFSDEFAKDSLLDSPEKFIAEQKFAAVKPAPMPPVSAHLAGNGKRSSNAQFNQMLIASLFATISSILSSIANCHVPFFDEEAAKNADKALVSHLQTLSEFKQLYKNYYQNCNFNIEFSTRSCLEFQVNENQHKLRALEFKLEEIQKVNSGLSRKLSCYSLEEDSADVLLNFKGEPSFHRFGFIMCIGAMVARALKSVVHVIMTTHMFKEKLNSMNLLLCMAPIAVVFLLPITLWMEDNVIGITLALARDDIKIVWNLIFKSALAYFVNLTNFLVMKHTTSEYGILKDRRQEDCAWLPELDAPNIYMC